MACTFIRLALARIIFQANLGETTVGGKNLFSRIIRRRHCTFCREVFSCVSKKMCMKASTRGRDLVALAFLELFINFWVLGHVMIMLQVDGSDSDNTRVFIANTTNPEGTAISLARSPPFAL